MGAEAYMSGLARGAAAGLEEASQFVSAEVAPTGLGLATHGSHRGGGLVVRGGDQHSRTTPRGAASIRFAGGGLGVVLKQLADAEVAAAAEPVPGHGSGVRSGGSRSSDPGGPVAPGVAVPCGTAPPVAP